MEITSVAAAISAKRAYQSGELYLIAIDGFTLRVPGVSDAELERGRELPVRVVENTGDAIRNEEDARWRKFAREYAAEFNEYIIQYLTSR